MKHQQLFVILACVTLGACATPKGKPLPKETLTTLEVIEQAEVTSAGRAKRFVIEEPLHLNANQGVSTTARQVEDLNRDFRRVPNPEIVGFMFAHRVGEIPIPGFATVFPLYERDHYAVRNEGFLPSRGDLK